MREGQSVQGVADPRDQPAGRDVFISHSTKDREVAEGICALLEAQGVSCWIAPRDVTPGKNFGEEIIDAIEGTRATVLVLSDHSNASVHVRHEVERAVANGKTVFPVRIRDVPPARALELFISSSQWIDAWTPPLEGGIRRLAHAVKVLLGSATGPAPSVPLPPKRTAVAHAVERPGGSPAPKAAVAAALLVAAVAGILWWRGTFAWPPGLVVSVKGPSEADVVVDGRLVGRSAADATHFDVAEGAHRVQVRADGYWTYQQDVDVHKRAVPLTVTLARVSSLDVTVNAPGAQVRVDGQRVDRPFPLSLPDGQHSIDVSAPGYEAYHQVVTLEGGRRESLAVSLNSTRRADTRPERAPAPEQPHAQPQPENAGARR